MTFRLGRGLCVMLVLSFGLRDKVVDGTRKVNVVVGSVEFAFVYLDVQKISDGGEFEVRHFMSVREEILRGQNHDVDGIAPEPRAKVFVTILAEKAAQEVVVEACVIVADKKEFVRAVVAVDVARKHIDQLAIDLVHGRIVQDLLFRNSGNLESLRVNDGTRIGTDVPVEVFFRLAVNNYLTTYLMNAVAGGVGACSFKVKEKKFHFFVVWLRCICGRSRCGFNENGDRLKNFGCR